jgi:hypothetical protein
VAATRVIPPVNATVVRVESGDGVERWTGEQPAHVLERTLVEPGDTVPSYIATVTIVVPSTVPVKVTDRVTVTRRATQRVYLVESVEDRSDHGFTRLLTRSHINEYT